MADELKKDEGVVRKVLHVREVIDDLFKQKDEIMYEPDPKALADRVAVLLHTLEDARSDLEKAYPGFQLEDQLEEFWGRLLTEYKQIHKIGFEIDNNGYDSRNWIDLDTKYIRWKGAAPQHAKVYAEMYTVGGDHEFPVTYFRVQMYVCVRYNHSGGGYDNPLETFIFIPTEEEGNSLVKVADRRLKEKFLYVSHGNDEVEEGYAEFVHDDSERYGKYNNDKMWAALKAHCETRLSGLNDERSGS